MNLSANQHAYAQASPGRASLPRAPFHHWRQPAGLAHAWSVGSSSSEDAPRSGGLGRGIELAESCQRSAGAGWGLALGARDSGSRIAGARGRCALPRPSFTWSWTATAKAAAHQQLTGPVSSAVAMNALGEWARLRIRHARRLSFTDLAAWRLPALFWNSSSSAARSSREDR